jgi:hypothetical protein
MADPAVAQTMLASDKIRTNALTETPIIFKYQWHIKNAEYLLVNIRLYYNFKRVEFFGWLIPPPRSFKPWQKRASRGRSFALARRTTLSALLTVLPSPLGSALESILVLACLGFGEIFNPISKDDGRRNCGLRHDAFL